LFKSFDGPCSTQTNIYIFFITLFSHFPLFGSEDIPTALNGGWAGARRAKYNPQARKEPVDMTFPPV
jgi:hypothetical protein